MNCPPSAGLKRARVRVTDVRSGHIWTNQIDGRTCKGDSGAPLFKLDSSGTRHQVGVHSRSGTSLNPCTSPMVAVSVPANLSWIRSVMNNN